MTIAKFLKNKEILLNTLFIIDASGHGYYIEKGQLYTRKEFECKYPLPASIVTNNKPNADSTKNWLITN